MPRQKRYTWVVEGKFEDELPGMMNDFSCNIE
jgi:hypothetical protein